jgi:starch phosphorylase
LNDIPAIAYFSMEIAIDETMPTYSGGLGVLAGDTLRAMADAALPVAAVTLAYQKGYYRQSLDEFGTQTEAADPWSPADRLELADVSTEIAIEGRTVVVRAWRAVIEGHTGATVPVYLLDTDLPQNDPWDRTLSHVLYGGDKRYRLAQEAVLGLAGKAIVEAATGGNIVKYHMNEGHSALVVPALFTAFHGDLGRVREACVFTTHTPVPAGHDRFDRGLAEHLLDRETVATLEKLGQLGHDLNMTTLALHGSGFCNAVAMKHGEVSRAMFPGYEIAAITNGVHAGTWVAPACAKLFDERLPGWRGDNFRLRQAVGIPLDEIAAAHAAAKRALVEEVERRVYVELDPNAFTLGFARRAATYKRADLLFTHPDWLRAIARRHGAIQIVYAGKAHPHDDLGKALIRRVYEQIKEIGGNIRAVYLPNYDMHLGRLMTAGVDVWLNTPRRPEEASGTSGMKAALNGVPSLSILDGWWIEGHVEGRTGWAVGNVDDPIEQDALSLYHALERVLKTYYRDPERFAEIRRTAIGVNGSYFTTERMVREYAINAYGNAALPTAGDATGSAVA